MRDITETMSFKSDDLKKRQYQACITLSQRGIGRERV